MPDKCELPRVRCDELAVSPKRLSLHLHRDAYAPVNVLARWDLHGLLHF